jgi:tripartite-type tricarboxylate transporter receptor subunit TctC
MRRRELIIGAGGSWASSVLPRLAQAQSAFAAPMAGNAKILCGFPPGGTADSLARHLAQKLRGTLASDVTVENTPGSGGQLAITRLMEAAPDGSTLLLTPSSMLAIYPLTQPKLNYTATDVAPISVCAYFSHAFAVGPAVPASVVTMQDFAAWIRADGERARFGSPAAGSMPHLIGTCVFKLMGQEIRHVALRGGGPGIEDLLAGKIPAMCAPVGEFMPHLKRERLRLIAVSSTGRNPFIPGTPTFREQGIPITMREWYGMYLPGPASAPTRRAAAAHLLSALAQPDVVAQAATMGLEIQSSTPEIAASTLQADAADWRRLIKIIGFTAAS